MFRKILLLASMVATLTLAVIAVGSLPASRLASLKIAGLPQTAWPISIPMFSSPPSGVEPLDRIEIITQMPPEDDYYDAPPVTGAVTAIKPIAAFRESLGLGYDYDLPDDVRLKSGQDLAHEANIIPDSVAIDNLPLTTYWLVDPNPRLSQDISPASGRTQLTDQEAELAITFCTSPSGRTQLTDQEAELAITFSTSPAGTAAKKTREAKSRSIKTAMVKKSDHAAVTAAQPSLFPWGSSPGMNPFEPFQKKVPNPPSR